MGLSRIQKIRTIEEQLNFLFCFTAEENIEYMRRIRMFPVKGLDEFMMFLKEAKQAQDKVLALEIQRNPEFSKAFSRFLNQTTLAIKNEYEQKEKQGAESILKKIK